MDATVRHQDGTGGLVVLKWEVRTVTTPEKVPERVMA
jgi:hypothetical protein